MIVKQIRIVLAVVAMIALTMTCAAAGETVVGDVDARLGEGQIEYEGRIFRPRRRITSILLIGTDHRGDEGESERFRSGTQADFLMLLVIDDNEKKITPIQINRDTMAEITTLSSFGEDMGLWTAQICLAHSFGDGKKQSCELAVQAVSRYLHDATIDGYISLNLDGIAAFKRSAITMLTNGSAGWV